MKIAVKYINNPKDKTQLVQLPLVEWEKLLLRLRKYEQILKLKSDLKEAIDEVEELKKSKAKRQTLSDFLNGL